MKIVWRMLLFVIIVWFVQHFFIAYTPRLIFEIAKYKKRASMNTLINVNQTDASLRQVVLPNPDFVYSACFYDLSKSDLLITGEFADSTHYCSLALYNDNVQPYYVRNNMQGFKKKFTLRLSYVNRVQGALRAESQQGVLLLRVLSSDSAQRAKAINVQQTFKVIEISQND